MSFIFPNEKLWTHLSSALIKATRSFPHFHLGFPIMANISPSDKKQNFKSEYIT